LPTSQRGLRELRDGEHVVGRAVRGEPRIGHLVVDDAVDRELRVVLRDADLLGNIERHFLEHVTVGHAVDERHDQVQARLERAEELAEPLDHPGVLLGHDAHALEEDHHHHGHEERGDRGGRAMGHHRHDHGEDDGNRGFPEHGISLCFVVGAAA